MTKLTGHLDIEYVPCPPEKVEAYWRAQEIIKRAMMEVMAEAEAKWEAEHPGQKAVCVGFYNL